MSEQGNDELMSEEAQEADREKRELEEAEQVEEDRKTSAIEPEEDQ